MVPTNRGRMCTLTNENVIPITCITTEAPIHAPAHEQRGT